MSSNKRTESGPDADWLQFISTTPQQPRRLMGLAGLPRLAGWAPVVCGAVAMTLFVAVGWMTCDPAPTAAITSEIEPESIVYQGPATDRLAEDSVARYLEALSD